VVTGVIKQLILAVSMLLLMSADVQALSAYDNLRKSYVQSDSFLLDRNGNILQELRTDKQRRRLEWTELNAISPSLKEAIIAAEDKRFYGHSGVDYQSLGVAVFGGMSGEGRRGASTITMQLAVFLDKELIPVRGRKSVWQKGKQILAARDIEKSWTKNEIFEAYLNLVTFRGEYQGIAAASRCLFGKYPHGLNQAEALVLAALIRAPNAAADEVASRVSRLGQSLNWLDAGAEAQAKIKQLQSVHYEASINSGFAPHVARQLLRNLSGSAQVKSTLDGRLQKYAHEQLHQQLTVLYKLNVNDGAFLVLENKSGDVLAYGSIGGEPKLSMYVDGVRAKRQAGSTLKPFLYALAFDQHLLTAASILDDSPLDISVNTGIYQPKNYDSEFQGMVTARAALASSLNVPAVSTLMMVGTEQFVSVLRKLGIKNLSEAGDYYGPALALGSADVSLWELTNAYRTLANLGEAGEARLVVDAKNQQPRRKIFSAESAYIIADILSDRAARSITFGLENPLATRFRAAVKTGTSKDMRDNWCIGYSGKYTVGVWVGNYTGEPMWNVSGITGAAPVWVEIMNYLHGGQTLSAPQIPAGLVKKEINNFSGTNIRADEWFIKGTEPSSDIRLTENYQRQILYPLAGTIIALDPDIPGERQKVFFIYRGQEEDLRWVLNEKAIEEKGKAVGWIPQTGKYFLSLRNQQGETLDAVQFEVRGTPEQ